MVADAPHVRGSHHGATARMSGAGANSPTAHDQAHLVAQWCDSARQGVRRLAQKIYVRKALKRNAAFGGFFLPNFGKRLESPIFAAASEDVSEHNLVGRADVRRKAIEADAEGVADAENAC